jgi:hypothetical protein
MAHEAAPTQKLWRTKQRRRKSYGVRSSADAKAMAYDAAPTLKLWRTKQRRRKSCGARSSADAKAMAHDANKWTKFCFSY